MFTSLTNAKNGVLLELVNIENAFLKTKLSRVGLNPGDRVKKIINNPDLRSVRIKIAEREVVLSGDMASEIVAHLDDGRKLPVSEMSKGETGHLEGKTGSRDLEKMLVALGIEEDDDLTLIRKLPPMTYTVVIEGNDRRKLTDSIVAKVLGKSEGKIIQLPSLNKDKALTIFETLCVSPEEEEYLENSGIVPGAVIKIESVEPEISLHLENGRKPLCITKDDGLILFLNRENSDQILVREVSS